MGEQWSTILALQLALPNSQLGVVGNCAVPSYSQAIGLCPVLSCHLRGPKTDSHGGIWGPPGLQDSSTARTHSTLRGMVCAPRPDRLCRPVRAPSSRGQYWLAPTPQPVLEVHARVGTTPSPGHRGSHSRTASPDRAPVQIQRRIEGCILLTSKNGEVRAFFDHLKRCNQEIVTEALHSQRSLVERTTGHEGGSLSTIPDVPVGDTLKYPPDPV